MFRNQYDSDVTVWSPQGRLFQVEYAMEAVNLGTTSVGLKSVDFAVVVGLYKPSAEVGLTHPKVMSIDRHVGMCVAGITADARILGQYLRTECLSYRHSYNSSYPVSRLATNLGNKMQISTQRYDRRPIGVGLLLAGYDEKGSHIYQIMPSANVFNCKAMAIGNRSQGARTYLGRYEAAFPDCTMNELICHGIQAVSFAAPLDEEMSICIGIVGKDYPFKILSTDESLSYQKTCSGLDDLENLDKSEPPESSSAHDFDPDPTNSLNTHTPPSTSKKREL
ncbi:proteasome subunit alpha type-1-like [Drosophila montana]|uniref:proteasome subunit alpha type-1-like n=1 Tax=Drosophila montana TaxID=40370 RepID=UPI00313F1381